MKSTSFYDDLSADYDRFVDWAARLAFEMPFFGRLFAGRNVRRVLDVACGTGHHAIAFAEAGYEATATDAYESMVQRARINAVAAGQQVAVHRLAFGELRSTLPGRYDAISCLGNSLPHLLSTSELQAALVDMASVLGPGGLLIMQNRNFDRVLSRQERFMSPEVHADGDEEWIFNRFYDFRGAQLRFNMIRLHRHGDGDWEAAVRAVPLYAWQRAEIRRELEASGLVVLAEHGSLGAESFEAMTSPDLIIVAERR